MIVTRLRLLLWLSRNHEGPKCIRNVLSYSVSSNPLLSRHSLEERLGLVPDRCKRSTDVAQLLHLAFYGETSVLIRHRLKEFPDSNCGFASFAILLRSFTISYCVLE